MSSLTFSQAERRNFLLPGVIAVLILAAGVGLFLWHLPSHMADLTVTHTAVLPTHTLFRNDTKLVGAPEAAEDDLYVLATVRVDNHLKVPLFVNDITGTLTAPDESVTNASAVEKNDLPNLFTTFPALKPLASEPLERESSIPPGGHAEGMVLLHFPVAEADWKQRKSASVTVDFYHQGPLTVEIPKS